MLHETCVHPYRMPPEPFTPEVSRSRSRDAIVLLVVLFALAAVRIVVAWTTGARRGFEVAIASAVIVGGLVLGMRSLIARRCVARRAMRNYEVAKASESAS